MFNSVMTVALRTLSTLKGPQKPLIFSGAGATSKLADFMVQSGHRRPLLVTGGFALKHGMLDDLIAVLEEGGCKVTIFDEIVPNPTLAVVEAGLAASRENDCDAVFAVGGGSAIDVAKVIASASTSRKDLSKLAGILKVDRPLLPFYVAPTTSGTGSEVTSAAVISDTQTHKKMFFVDPKYIPVGAALDTDLLKSLPGPVTAATGMDALTHAIEAYTSRNSFPDSDRDAEMAIKLLFEFLPIVFRDGANARAREMVALGSFLAGYAFAKASLGYVHAISHQISARYDTPHGLANAVLLPRVLRFNKEACAGRYGALEAKLSGETGAVDAAELADRFIARVDALAEEVGIPVNLSDVQSQDYASIAKDALSEARWSYAVPRVMRRADVAKILQSVSSGDRDVSFA